MGKIAIIDYGLANIMSVYNAITCFGVDLFVAERGDQLHEAEKIILPGVGSFDAGIQGLKNRGHHEALMKLVREEGRPFLGICLGLQFLFEGSAEGGGEGLCWFPGRCERFPSGESKPKVPHIGWSDVEIVQKKSRLFAELLPPATFYFVHSYYAPFNETVRNIAAATCEHGIRFTAAIEHENIFATQFHPEKSQLAGMKLLETFVEGI
ncbi:MAG: imidazole glycerol phosphate synthase subunit HisH [Proteobacteria bacterium]|nr:imidazole glycerol phosphate synthase subunit HisH [Pseudomonadota bacterium]MBU1738779.1 imidazole glycerol phosphate synthase subunit HisH [Pseudomonadota bacterium]